MQNPDSATLAPFVATGTLLSLYARLMPDSIAVYSTRGNRTFKELNANANRLARTFRHAGLSPGDGVLSVCGNTLEFVEMFAATQRAGMRWTPVNWRLTPAEVDQIAEDSDAKAIIVHPSFTDYVVPPHRQAPLRLAISSPSDGARSYEEAIADQNPADLTDPALGQVMLYTSGTTGRPKGVYRKRPVTIWPLWSDSHEAYRMASDRSLCVGPGYHGGPLGFDIARPLASGVPIVLMERFDAAETLKAIERHRITHTHMVATMFQRMLALPADIRKAFDLSSLRVVFHGGAPTPIPVKQKMIDWWGPILVEYYAATESASLRQVRISSDEWLQRQGSVGHIGPDHGVTIRASDGQPVEPGKPGLVCFRNDTEAGFEYFGDPQKTEGARVGPDFTVGDVGRVDADGYLYLTGRTADCIISGGVNIYPQEIDDALIQHPDVEQCCTVGAPNDEWGEEVTSVVILMAGALATQEKADEIRAFARARIADYKCPRRIDFDTSLPQSDSGKIQRALVRQRYWAGRGMSI